VLVDSATIASTEDDEGSTAVIKFAIETLGGDGGVSVPCPCASATIIVDPSNPDFREEEIGIIQASQIPALVTVKYVTDNAPLTKTLSGLKNVQQLVLTTLAMQSLWLQNGRDVEYRLEGKEIGSEMYSEGEDGAISEGWREPPSDISPRGMGELYSSASEYEFTAHFTMHIPFRVL